MKPKQKRKGDYLSPAELAEMWKMARAQDVLPRKYKFQLATPEKRSEFGEVLELAEIWRNLTWSEFRYCGMIVAEER